VYTPPSNAMASKAVVLLSQESPVCGDCDGRSVRLKPCAGTTCAKRFMVGVQDRLCVSGRFQLCPTHRLSGLRASHRRLRCWPLRLVRATLMLASVPSLQAFTSYHAVSLERCCAALQVIVGANKCEAGCGKWASFGFAGERARFCKAHMEAGMVRCWAVDRLRSPCPQEYVLRRRRVPCRSA